MAPQQPLSGHPPFEAGPNGGARFDPPVPAASWGAEKLATIPAPVGTGIWALDLKLAAQGQRVAERCAAAACGVALLALAGWLFDVKLLASQWREGIPMAPSSALALLCLGGGVFSHARWPTHPSSRRVALAAAGLAAMLALLALAQFLTGRNWGLELALAGAMELSGRIPLGRMSPLTVVSVLLESGALLFLLDATRWRLAATAAALLALVASVVALVILLGYCYGVAMSYGPPIPMAVSTALALALVGGGQIKLALPGVPALRPWRGDSMRAVLVRAFVPTALPFLLLQGWLQTLAPLRGRAKFLWDSLTAFVASVLILATIGWVARRIGDATDQMQGGLRNSEKNFRKLFDCAPVAYHELDTDGVVRRVNQAECALLGYEAGEMLGRPIWEFILPADREESRQAFHRKLTGELPLAPVQRRYVRRDGSELWVEIHDILVRGAAGETAGIRTALLDITGRKRAEERIEKTLMRQRGVSRLQQSLLGPAPLEHKLRQVAAAIVRLFDADFCRIWLIRPGDLCERGCPHAKVRQGPHVCRQRDRCLHLLASAGRYTHIDGPGHGRVPFGCYKIGRVASDESPKFVSNDVQNDPNVHDHGWARELGLVAFAGYQLRTPGENTLGVLALFSKHPILADEDAMLEGLGSTVARVVKQAVAEEALRAKENILSESQRIAHVGSWSWDAPLDTAVCAWTPETYRVFGVSPDVFVPTAEMFLSLIHEEDRAAMQDWIRACLAGEEPPDLEFRVNLADGGVRHILGRGHLERGAANQPVRVTGIAQDITERKRLEEALKVDAEKLARSNAELERFAYVASHDLQEPLRMVASFTQLLAKRYSGKLDETADRYIDFAVDGAKRMQQLIADLLAYSRVNSKDLDLRETDCEAVVLDAMQNLRAAIEESGTAVTRDPLPTLWADQTQLTQLFQNLIGNAIKFRRNGERPQIHISAAEAGPDWLFSVKDNGIGIDPRHADRVFQIFQRLHTRAEYPGTGIGLAVCQKAVERHGGKIWVESEPGVGSTFSFTIPKHKRTE